VPSSSVVPLLIGGLTSSIGLEVAGGRGSGEVVLVTGASGNTGLFAVQLAKLAGNTVIGTCGSDDKKAVLSSLGCDRPVNYKTEDLVAVVKKEFPRGVDLVFEGVGGRMLEACKQCLAPGSGRLVSMGFTSKYTDKNGFDSAEAKLVKTGGQGAIRGFLLKDYPALQSPHLAKLTQLVAAGRLKPVCDPTPFAGLEAVADAVEFLTAGNNVGKPVVRMCSADEAAAATPPAAAAATAATPSPAVDVTDDAPGVGSMERVHAIQADCFAEDVEVHEGMATWSEARLTAFFENGGVE